MSRKKKEVFADETGVVPAVSGADVASATSEAITYTKIAESKTDKFRRLANKRLPKAIKAIAACRNLSAKSQYGHTAEEARKLVGYLRGAVEAVEQAFMATEATKTPEQLF